MVRLKGKWTAGWNIRLEISIPYGAIKSNVGFIKNKTFLIISIPYGAIKSRRPR